MYSVNEPILDRKNIKKCPHIRYDLGVNFFTNFLSMPFHYLVVISVKSTVFESSTLFTIAIYDEEKNSLGI
jgi:hypothetical protein